MEFEELQLKLNEVKSAQYKGKLNEGEQLAIELLALLESSKETDTSKNWEIKFNTFLQLSYIKRYQGETDTALEYARAAHETAAKKSSKSREAVGLQAIGNAYRYMSEYQHSLEYLGRSLVIAEEIGDIEFVGILYSNMSDIYSILTEYTTALEYSGRALALKDELGKTTTAIILANMGHIYSELSDFPKALECMMNAIPIYEELEAKGDLAGALGNIGIVYYQLEDFPHALEYMQRSAEMLQQCGMKTQAATMYGNVGNIYFSLRDYVKALEYMQMGLPILREMNARVDLANIIGNIGSVYNEMGDFRQALEYLNESLQLYQELNIKTGIQSKICIMGSIYANPDFEGYNPAKAEDMLIESLNELEELGVLGHNLKQLKLLAEFYERTAQWEKANHFNKKHFAIEKELFSDEVRKQAEKFAFDRKIAEEQAQRKATEALLHNILPKKIADRMMEKKTTISDYFENVSIFFSDIVDFTTLSTKISPQQLVEGLNAIFSEFDRIAIKHGLEKIKTIGDSYMAVCGIPEPCDNHAERVAMFALEVNEVIKNFSFSEEKIPVVNRIGLHSGSVVAGVIGENKFAYDLWGDSVNTASRMESHGEPGKIHVSEDFIRTLTPALFQEEKDLYNYKFDSEVVLKNHYTLGEAKVRILERGDMVIKGKGKMKTFFLERN